MPQHELDLDAYLARIRLAPGPPSLTLLRALIARHTDAIPFENFDIILGREIRLDIEAIQAKLVQAGRGGYCFEQNTLLQAALQGLGFAVTSLMARVAWRGPADAMTPRTHMLLRVVLPEGPYLADVGFGNLTPTAPLRLDRTEAQDTGHEQYRLRPQDGETLLQARLGEEWVNVYRFSAAPSHPSDHEVGNWFTATKPGRLFTANAVAARPGTGCRRTLLNNAVTVRGADNRMDQRILTDAAALRDTLRDDFAITLDEADLATLHGAIRRFAERGAAGFRFD